jgi:2-C-methyl-D-erythritol 2,4-cyclodiphosphate synthase
LRYACDLARKAGYRLENVDSTVLLERPKLKDFRVAIRQSLADTMGLKFEDVSVKFKTAERLGPVGEGKSAEAQAIVILVRD